jgi:hypothetical protein
MWQLKDTKVGTLRSINGQHSFHATAKALFGYATYFLLIFHLFRTFSLIIRPKIKEVQNK